jgi:periplasmic divalent cation tolerance protein
VSIVSVYAVFADAQEAERIGRAVINERLAACINILAPCRSIYRWEGAVETADEVPAILKTDSGRAKELVERIAALHSYDTPCVTVWPIETALERYVAWVKDSVSG